MPCYNTATIIVQRLVEEGYTAYFAGGYVRDYIMKHPSDDIDIATDADVETVQKIFPKTIPVGVQFGIVIVVLEGYQFEVATFRKESGYKDGRRPTSIEKADPKEDALRRDFTINGMFFDPLTETLYDYVEGQRDIKHKIIRAIGNPHERFQEDRLRMIRAVRYAARFHFTIEEETKKAIFAHAAELFPSVAIERIYHELEKMAAFSNFDKALCHLHNLGLLAQIFPSLKDLPTERLEKKVALIPLLPKKTPVIGKILELFPRASLAERLGICDYLKLSNKHKEFVAELELWRSAGVLDDYEWTKIYAKPHAEICLEIVALQKDDAAFKRLHREKMEELEDATLRAKQGKTLVTSKDLANLGIAPGKKMGALLEEAERLAVNQKLTDIDTILKKLKPMISS